MTTCTRTQPSAEASHSPSIPASGRPALEPAAPPPSSASTAWRDFRRALSLGQPRAKLRLLATVTGLVSHAGRSLTPEARTDACERIAAALAARIRMRRILTPMELLHAIDVEIARWLRQPAPAAVSPSAALLAQLGDALARLPDAQQRAVSAYYGAGDGALVDDAGSRRQALGALRRRLALDAGR